MAKEAIVDKEKCVGSGTCVALCPNVFQMDDDGKAYVTDSAGASEQEIQQAIDACPVQAIKWK